MKRKVFKFKKVADSGRIYKAVIVLIEGSYLINIYGERREMKTYKLKQSAFNYLLALGYQEYQPVRKTKDEYLKQLKENGLDRIRLWIKSIQEFLNIKTIAAHLGWTTAKFRKWMVSGKGEMSEADYQKLRNLRSALRGLKH